MDEKSEATEMLDPMASRRPAGDAKLVRIVTTAQLLARGHTGDRIKTLVRRGVLVRVGHGCYATAGVVQSVLRHPDGRHLLAAGAALAGPGRGLVASHTTGARIHGLDLLDRPGPEVTLTRIPGDRQPLPG